MERLEALRVNGPTQRAFSFKAPIPPPGGEVTSFPETDAEFCIPRGD
jgi:hypothetical protein